jgi:uncharacterized membrane protein
MSDTNDKPNLLQVIASMLAGAFGVQSEKNRLRDFQHGSAKAYIVAGIIGTVIFVLTVYGVVKLVLSGAGK